jgi:hypothetical protein
MKKIKFGVQSEHLQEIVPAKSKVPDWYRETPLYADGAKKFSISKPNMSFKGCSPFMDSFTTGYVATLWQSVEVTTREDGTKDLSWPLSEYPIAKIREAGMNEQLPVPAGHTNQHFSWTTPFSIKTPPGYSAIITHPLNRFDLPFTTLSGVVDLDGVMGPGSLPFFIREDFEGIIPAGTPIFQLIPFKRDEWTSVTNEETREEGNKARHQSMAFVPGFYKKNKWVKKRFD